MDKLEVKICFGTTCFVMGASGLQELKDIIPARYHDRVSVAGSLCLGNCYKHSEYSKAPYVEVGGEVVEDATVEKVLAVIDAKLAANE